MAKQSDSQHVMPSEVDEHVGWFDRFAQHASDFVSRSLFFAFCVLMVVVWVPTIFLMKFETSQLLINTSTTIITFLMVAVLQNSQSRGERAVQQKLNAVADALADLMEATAKTKRVSGLRKDARELKDAVGLEFRESS